MSIVGVFTCALVHIHYTFIWGNGEMGFRGNGRLGETGNWLLNGLIGGNGSISRSVSDC